MFLKKTDLKDKQIRDALMQGIQEGKKDLLKFNGIAGEVLAGLDALRSVPGSTLTYELAGQFNSTSRVIKTNIPHYTGTMDIIINEDLIVAGDSYLRNVRGALKAIARDATKAGLIPTM